MSRSPTSSRSRYFHTRKGEVLQAGTSVYGCPAATMSDDEHYPASTEVEGHVDHSDVSIPSKTAAEVLTLPETQLTSYVEAVTDETLPG